MALDDPLQWIVIAVVAIVFLMWGPKKIPELARSIGLARKEFNNASVGAAQVSPAAPPRAAPATAPAPSVTGDALIDTAKKLGISTAGKSRNEISEAIVARSKN